MTELEIVELAIAGIKEQRRNLNKKFNKFKKKHDKKWSVIDKQFDNLLESRSQLTGDKTELVTKTPGKAE